jgi:hypothetical protein
MAWRSGGLAGLLHQRDEAVEQVADVLRAGRRLGVALEAERRLVLELEALQRAVEQADVRARTLPAGLGSTAKPWFWLVMLTRPLARSAPGGWRRGGRWPS